MRLAVEQGQRREASVSPNLSPVEPDSGALDGRSGTRWAEARTREHSSVFGLITRRSWVQSHPRHHLKRSADKASGVPGVSSRRGPVAGCLPSAIGFAATSRSGSTRAFSVAARDGELWSAGR